MNKTWTQRMTFNLASFRIFSQGTFSSSLSLSFSLLLWEILSLKLIVSERERERESFNHFLLLFCNNSFSFPFPVVSRLLLFSIQILQERNSPTFLFLSKFLPTFLAMIVSLSDFGSTAQFFTLSLFKSLSRFMQFRFAKLNSGLFPTSWRRKFYFFFPLLH